jgi:hypothetical protein
MLDRLADLIRPAILRKPDKASEHRALAEVIGRCPICNRSLTSQHRFWILATAVPGSQAAERLMTQLRARAWSLARVHDWYPEKDSIQITMIQCPYSTDVAMTQSFHPFSMFSSSYLESSKRLGDVDSKEILLLANDDWTSF